MTSFNLNYLLKAHLQIQPHWELGLQHEIWGRTVQSIAGPFLKTFLGYSFSILDTNL